MDKAFYTFTGGGGPLIATAIHDGHAVRTNLIKQFQLSGDERLREEDPYTGILAKRFPNHLLGLRSRFEVDLNRPRDKAIYRQPEDAWGLHVWNTPLTDEQVASSHQLYDEFYSMLEVYLQGIIDRFGYVLVLDLHSYNHRREGADGPEAPIAENPEINLGTGGMDMKRWRPVVDAFHSAYRQQLPETDIRENVKFEGGNFMRWIHRRFGSQACALAVEFKKVFMDEWTGRPDELKLKDMRQALWVAGKEMELTAANTHKVFTKHDRGPISDREGKRTVKQAQS